MVNVIFLAILSIYPLPDSLRMETINGKVFIIHQVGEKETLYGVSRRYGTPITAILEFNAKAASGLEVGQLLQIPYVPKVKVAAGLHKVSTKETLFSIARQYEVSVDELKAWNNLKDNNLSLGQDLIVKKPPGAKEVVKSVAVETPLGRGMHRVEEKETFFSISKLFGVTIKDIKDWNGITGDELKVGQVLIVAAPAGSTSAMVIPEIRQETKNNAVKEEPRPEVKTENTIRISENTRGSDEVKEGGLAELIEGTDGNRKYLALHRTAKTGAIIKVRNELNNREVFVRVVGPLPDTGINDKLVIKISKSAFDRLGAIDSRFRVEVTYYK